MDVAILNRKNNFNLLRLVFASLVIVSHSFEILDGNRLREPLTRMFGTLTFGDVAVDGFFLLSGFLIAKSWKSQPRAISFMRKRVLRIYPGFIAASIVSLLLVGFIGWCGNWSYFSQIKPVYAIARMLLLLPPSVTTAFPGSYHDALNGSMWTISLEFSCYLTICLLGMTKLLYRTWFIVVLAVTLLVINAILSGLAPYPDGQYLVVADFIHHVGVKVPGPFTFLLAAFIRLAGVFLAGTSFFLLVDKISFNWRIGSAAIVVLVAAMFSPSLAEAGIAIAGGYLLFWFSFCGQKCAQLSESLPDYSYGIYLYGWPIQKILISVVLISSPWLVILVTFAIDVIMGAASWYLVERRFVRRRKPSPKVLVI